MTNKNLGSGDWFNKWINRLFIPAAVMLILYLLAITILAILEKE